MLWKKLDAKKAENESKQRAADTIVPDADSLVYDSYYDRLKSIQDRSTSATQGAIAADATKKQYEAAVKAAEMEKQRQKALETAYNGMNNYAGGQQAYGAGSGGGGNWGAGGAQGVANVLRQAGFPESAVPTMMAIAMAESSWNPGVTHKNSNGSIDQGLFQINSIHRGNSWYPSNPMDPLQSAQAAFALWKGAGGSYRDWTVYNSGAYKKFLQSAPPIQPYVANTSGGLAYAQVGQAQNYSGVPTSNARQQAVNISKAVLNIPYVWGGNSLQTGVDCSGLVQQVYARMGISMPRQARAQATTGVRVGSYNQLQPGDLVAFKWAGGYAGPNVVSHISIYIGNGQIIEAYGGSKGRIRGLGNSAQDRGAIYIHTRFPGE
jgi:cell wall-associated NlpC family hydrolase